MTKMPRRTFFITRNNDYFFIWGTDWRTTNRIADSFDPNWLASFSDSMFSPGLFNMCLGEVK